MFKETNKVILQAEDGLYSVFDGEKLVFSTFDYRKAFDLACHIHSEYLESQTSELIIRSDKITQI